MKAKDSKVDYAPHYLELKNGLKTVYELLNKGEYLSAATLVDKMTVECRLLRTAIKSHVKH
jgi:hypothetical protein